MSPFRIGLEKKNLYVPHPKIVQKCVKNLYSSIGPLVRKVIDVYTEKKKFVFRARSVSTSITRKIYVPYRIFVSFLKSGKMKLSKMSKKRVRCVHLFFRSPIRILKGEKYFFVRCVIRFFTIDLRSRPQK